MKADAIARNREVANHATPEIIARLLPPLWAFTHVSLESALDYYYPEGAPTST